MNTNAPIISVEINEVSQSEHTGVTSTQIKKQLVSLQKPLWNPHPVTNPLVTIGLLILKISEFFLFLSLVNEIILNILLCVASVDQHHVCEIYPFCFTQL